MNKKMQGFTIIEIMVVVAIIGMLATLAIPAYQNHVIRTQVSEGIALTNAAKATMGEHFTDRGDWPPDNIAAGLAAADTIISNYVTSVEVSGPAITVTFGNNAHNEIAGRTLTLSVTEEEGSFVWACSSVDIQANHLPSACR